MPTFIVDESACRKDGICSAVCPTFIIKGEVGAYPQWTAKAEERCIGCGQCVAFCPSGAVTLKGLPMEKALPIEKEKLPSAEQTALLLKSRRSTRKFKKTPVPKEIFLEILDSANNAPTAKNRRPVRWIIVHDREHIVELGDIVCEALSKFVAENEKSIMTRTARAMVAAWKRGHDPIFRHAPHLVCAVTPTADEWEWATIDGAIALSYLEIAAVPYNVGACWAGYFTHTCASYPPLRKALGLADNEQVAGAQIMGFAALKSKVLPPRNDAPIDWR